MGYPAEFASVTPSKAALVMVPSGAAITYRELDERSFRLARFLEDRGIPVGATVAMISENRLEWAEVMWAAARSGLDSAPVNWHLGADEVDAALRACEARVVVTSALRAPVVSRACAALGHIELVLIIGSPPDDVSWPAGIVEQYEPALASVNQDVPLKHELMGGRVMFSSGTTGAPKAVRHPASPVHPKDAPPHLGEYTDLLHLRGDTVYLSSAPTYHTAPFRFVFAVLQLGGTVVCLESFDAVVALEAVERYRVTHAQFVPTMLKRLHDLAEPVKDAFDVSSLRVALTGAAPCPPELKKKMIEWWGPVVHELYGASEGYGNCHIGPDEALEHPGSVGRALRGTIHITDSEGNVLPAGKDGIIWFAGASPLERGARMPADAERSGWRSVGDVGHVDVDGYLYLTGRANQMIISGGVNIHPQESENLLGLHPAVTDVAVVGLPDAEFGEIVAAYVVPRDGVPRDGLADELIGYCRSRIAHFKCPKVVFMVDALPRGENGKMYTRLLRR
ncbi:AMP-binding protein [Nocardia carnea]|uniref:AMP-binding protein n=1 Tax=Nocardia carnea TaxID=37328 RepID=UPI00245455FA|nr:AMP-binding protein [Nocardia carnea]